MHELSIIQSVVTTVSEALAGREIGRVESVRLRIGALSSVVEDALQFGYEIATEGTILSGSRLEVVYLPVVIYCKACDQLGELKGINSFRCPNCGRPSGDIRQGRELEIDSVEVVDPYPVESGHEQAHA